MKVKVFCEECQAENLVSFDMGMWCDLCGNKLDINNVLQAVFEKIEELDKKLQKLDEYMSSKV